MTDKQIKLLKLCNKKQRTAEYLCKKLGVDFDCLNLMVSDQECYKCLYIENANGCFKDSLLKTTHSGQTVVSAAQKENFSVYYPNVVSSLALLVSIIALIVSIAG